MQLAVARHSETQRFISITVDANGRIIAEAVPDAGQTWVRDPEDRLGRSGLTGTWRHFKGGVYHFLGRAEGEAGPLLVYQDAEGRVWVRPEPMVCEEVDRAEYRGPRFVRDGG